MPLHRGSFGAARIALDRLVARWKTRPMFRRRHWNSWHAWTLGNWFLHDNALPPLVHAAMAHAQFEAIHPCLDGNGRVGRLIITLVLVEREIIPSPLLYLSAHFAATREEYLQRLLGVT